MQTVSVVVPALDEAASIAATLAPLQPLRGSGDVEVVVVDGGSRDATAAIARPLADRVIEAPRGRAVQMNAGAALARGGVLVFLHADSSLPEGWKEAVLDAIAGGAAWGRFDVSIDGRSRLLRVVSAAMNLRSRLTGIATGDQAIFVRRDAFEACGGFPMVALMEDIRLCARLKRAAGRPACLPLHVTTSGRRWDDGGAARTILLMWRLRCLHFFGVEPARLAAMYRERRSGAAARPERRRA